MPVTRRVLLAAAIGALLAPAAAAAPTPKPTPERSVFVRDYRLQQQVLRSQQLLTGAREVYQNWLSGRLNSVTARARLHQFLTPLRQAQEQANRFALPEDRNWLAANAQQQNAEMRFFEAQLARRQVSKDLAADLQQRWMTSLRLRRAWLQARQARLPALHRGASGQLRHYYDWRLQILGLELSELSLAEELAESFRDKSRPAQNWTRRGLDLYARAQALPAAGALGAAQRVVLERFAALSRLCRSAVGYQLDPGSDSAENLQEDEKSFQKLALQSEEESLKALNRCLTLK